MLSKIFLIFFMLFSIIFSFDHVYAISEPILITKSYQMNDIIFDGKWTNYLEWKPSSHTPITYEDGMIIHLRSAHYEDSIYVLVDVIGDNTLDKNSDKATICFDGKNEKNSIPDKNDYCFTTSLSQKEGKLFQGDSISKLTGNFKRISNVENFLAISSVSDENDRYSKIPHPSYEFKIPIDLIERSDNYGFYMSVYDASSNTFYSWPVESSRENFAIPSPSTWGDIISPDKSLPEFPLPIIILAILILSVIILQSKMNLRILPRA